ncbi:EamA family transporter [Gluconacetobacter azotocaptans]|uniref:EamA family transporter n=1 Tax=Gluconacetobacter azotocaptans TaxID=142834 RepID=A0A7W4PF65_9PROT|nr:SMR family transporter [Gluconacetobacter azotocaptans]MBB2188581.1 EamA family transporter [Gluconacetobacter azotocaptans]MBM9400286.1 EamA family transporter [Gluconacetobacter azotocaptans]GBQ28195.1 small multidrug resistance protein [Gluconacetobacter azotocaptans DSM 13594]
MTFGTIGLVLVSVLLSSSAQILLKTGMSDRAVQAAIASRAGVWDAVSVIALNVPVVLGLLAFGLSAVVWLLVLARIDVSQAYPCVAFGIVLTVLAGIVFLGEDIHPMRVVGLVVIVSGVVLMARAS